jgi:hypothetical protein
VVMDCITLSAGYDRLRYMQLAQENEEFLADMLDKDLAGYGDLGGNGSLMDHCSRGKYDMVMPSPAVTRGK